jgi:THO complex subunit 1
MPSFEVDDHGIQAITAFSSVLDSLLSRAEALKPTATIEPALDKSDFEDLSGQLSAIFPGAEAKSAQRYAVIETVARGIFSNLVVCILTIAITSATEFVSVLGPG